MAARKKNQDEKNLKLLREVANLAGNKQCFDCRQRGPTYVNMTIGSFVCTTCSGILRGLNPPHRVKSISMTSFTPEDVEFIKARGNEFCRKVWFGLSDSKTHIGPESKDEQKLKDFMMQVYDRKKWWIDPSTVAAQTAKIEQSVVSSPDKLPLSTLLGKSHTPLYVTNTQAPKPQQPEVTLNNNQQTNKLDLFAEFENDPFNSAPPQKTKTPFNTNFANFDENPAFPAPDLTSPLDTPFAPSTGTTSSAITANPTNDLFADNSNFGASSNLGFPTTAPTTAPEPFPSTVAAEKTTALLSNIDRYAALADLDSLFSEVTTSTPSSVWDNPATETTNSKWPTSTTTTESNNDVATAFGGDSAAAANPFGNTTAPVWNQAQPEPSNQMWGQPPGAPQTNSWGQPVPSAQQPNNWGQQPPAAQQPSVPQANHWGQQPPAAQQPSVPQANNWGQLPVSAPQPGQVPSGGMWGAPAVSQSNAQTWNQVMPSQAAFSTGNPFQMNQAAPTNATAAPVGQFVGQNGSMAPSDPNAGFAAFNTQTTMNQGFANFPQQSVTSPANGQTAPAPVQNGGFGVPNNNWNLVDSNSAPWGANPQAFQAGNSATNLAGANPPQFSNWQQPESTPSNPFFGGSGNPPAQKGNSSNPFL